MRDLSVGKIYSYVDGRPALPTIGIQPSPIPMYVALPRCPTYGTIGTIIWDTDDTRGARPIGYKYIYEGEIPMMVKTLELYMSTA